MRAEMSPPPMISIEMKPHHLFRYPSEWDPRQNGKTKGGYLEGKIILPKTSRNLRLLISTHPENKHNFKNVHICHSKEEEIHPTLIHVVRKGRGNRRYNEKEPVPNINHWQQEFEIKDKKVYICNKTSEMDELRYQSDNDRILVKDEMFEINDEMVLNIGKEAGELNMIILIPKTEKRANNNDVSLNKLLQGRTNNEMALNALSETYTGKNSVNLKKVRLKIEVFCLDSGVLLGSSLSCPISDTASKAHGAMDIHDATPLRSCADGGRKVVMIAEFGLAKDVVPRFQLYDSSDRRLYDEEEQLVQQPVASDISVLKESIIFITPPQPNAAKFLLNKYKIKLVARRHSDGYVSRKKFDFTYVPHDYFQEIPCMFCCLDSDNVQGKLVSISDSTNVQGRASLVALKEVARPGLRKRQMSGSDSYEVFDNTTAAKKNKILENDVKHFLPTVPLPPKILSSVAAPLSETSRKIVVDASNNLGIKIEPIDEDQTSEITESKIGNKIPFHDLSVVRTFTIPVTSGESLIMPSHIKKEVD